MSYADTIENWKKGHDAPPSLEDPDPAKEDAVVGCGTQLSEEPLPRAEPDEISKDSKRRSGDSGDWWYYLRNIGFMPIAVVVIISFCVLICENFPRTITPIPKTASDCICRDLAKSYHEQNWIEPECHYLHRDVRHCSCCGLCFIGCHGLVSSCL
jgi:hypothetical protein